MMHLSGCPVVAGRLLRQQLLFKRHAVIRRIHLSKDTFQKPVPGQLPKSYRDSHITLNPTPDMDDVNWDIQYKVADLQLQLDELKRQLRDNENLQQSVLLRKMQGHGDGGFIKGVVISADKKWVVSISDQLNAWDVASGELIFTAGHASPTTAVAIASDSQTVAFGCDDGTICIWNLDTHQTKCTLRGHARGILGLVFCGNFLASAALDGTIQLWLWHDSTGVLHKTISTDSHPLALASSADSKSLISGHTSGDVVIWDVDSGTETFKLQGHSDRVRAIAVSPNGEILASASDDRTIRFWTMNGHHLRAAKLRSKPRSLFFSSNAEWLMSGDNYSGCRVWKVATGSLVRKVPFAKNYGRLAVSSDHQLVAVAASDGTIQLHGPSPIKA